MTLSEKLSALIFGIFECIKEKLADESLAETIPNYSVSGLNISEHDLCVDGYLITHITDDLAYDERGLQYSLTYFLDEHLEKVCELLDSLGSPSED